MPWDLIVVWVLLGSTFLMMFLVSVVGVSPAPVADELKGCHVCGSEGAESVHDDVAVCGSCEKDVFPAAADD